MPSAPFVRRRLSLTPLVDVIFLLLLFFMLTSTFARFGEIELRAASGGAAGGAPPPQRAFVQLGRDRLALNGTPVTLGDLADRAPAGQILVSLDADTSAQRLVDLLAELRRRDDLDVVVLE